MDNKPAHHTADFEVIANQKWFSRSINKGDVVHFKRGIEPKTGDIVAVGNPFDSAAIQLHIYNGTQKSIAGVCVAVTRAENLNDKASYKRGCPDIQAAVQELWEAGANNLSDDALQWFKGFTDHAQEKCDELSDTLLNIGCVVLNDTDAGNFTNEKNVASLLFVVREQVNVISTMIEMGSNAAYRLEHPEFYKKGGV